MSFSSFVKLGLAIVFAVAVAFISATAAQKAVTPQMPEKNAYIVDVAAANAASAQQASTTTAPAAPHEHGAAASAKTAESAPIAELLAKADAAAGEKTAKVCATCHSFGKGEPAKVGPNLYGIVGLKHAHMAGFNYSAAMKEMAEHVWDFEELNLFIRNPREHLPGTKMTFAGLKNDQDRANVIAWLRTLSDKPVPLPK